MQVNLIPVSNPGVPLGGKVTNKAIERFAPYLLGVVIVVPEKELKCNGIEPTIENITEAILDTVIVLFREPNTIGMVTGFIHIRGMNINLSGTGSAYGEDFFNCLKQHNIEPWLFPYKEAYKIISEYAQDNNWYDNSRLDIIIRYWETFIINQIVPELYTKSIGLFGASTKTGTWIDSWEASDKSD